MGVAWYKVGVAWFKVGVAGSMWVWLAQGDQWLGLQVRPCLYMSWIVKMVDIMMFMIQGSSPLACSLQNATY